MPFIDLPFPPPAPQRSDEAEVFIERADAFVAWQASFAQALNTFVSQLETAAALIAAAPAYADPGLVAMTGKTPAADRLIYFTGAATSALTTLTGWARNLLADATAVDALDTLGVNDFAKALLMVAGDGAAWRYNIGAAQSGANGDIASLHQDVGITGDGTPSPTTLGFRGLPVNYKNSAYALSLGDMGQIVPIATGGITIPGGLPAGFACSLFNDSNSAQAITAAETLRFSGTTLTGTRSLLPYGLATVVKVKGDAWTISGSVS